ncbi:MAG: hypothetical protein ACD_41C00283G0001 [uncultured bacterium]|nr:MAG: hypothetical protein ACD_41C00283G0001 [uncultured bacterium]
MLISIEKLVFGGQGLGRVNNQVVFAWNALPSETVSVQITKKKKNYLEGIAEIIHTASPDRQTPLEDHWLSCSPWQIVSPQAEAAWKVTLAQESYFRLQIHPEFIDASAVTGYRNKMEYSFTHTATGEVCLALFKRGSHWRQPITPCVLASAAINQTAELVLAWLRTLPVTDHKLKSLIILSNERGDTIAGLFVRDRDFPAANTLGVTVYYSNPKSPASVPTELLAAGSTTITTTVSGTPLRHDLLGFFQVNVPVFEQALTHIGQAVAEADEVIDCYGGVGAISLPLHQQIKNCLIIDSNQQAIAAAQQNIQELGFTHYTAQCSPAEAVLQMFTEHQTIIVDPPRAGLHDDVTARLLTVRPKRIVYLSCNLSTQARDVERLLAGYTITNTRIFNFFPRTPHIEGLIVLDRRSAS